MFQVGSECGSCGGCFWVLPEKIKVGVFLLLVYRVFSSGQSSRMLASVSGDALQKWGV